VVTHEMDSAFTIADRMAMLDRGVMLCLEDRVWYERLRDSVGKEVESLDESKRLVRQFLRGDADGPLAARRDEASYSADLFGMTMDRVTRTPSVEPTRG